MKKITYVFLKDRNTKLSKESKFSRDFFYGATHFDDSKYEVKFLELESGQFTSNIILNIIDRSFKKFLNLPFNMEKIVSIKNYKLLKKSDHIFLVNETVAFSSLPLIFMLNLFSNSQISVFIMGLLSRSLKSKYLKIIHNFFVYILFLAVDDILFLGKPEYKKAKDKYPNNSKFHYIPFAVDTNFWSSKDVVPKKYDLIFVGNDLNKNYKFLLQLAKVNKKLNFLAISNNRIFEKESLINLKHVKSNLNEISDIELKNFYSLSRLSILPINETLQPSGQSVALQSMALKLPVLISETSGFWDKDIFKHNENILFLNNNIDEWSNAINSLLLDKNKINLISNNAYELISEEYNLDKFIEKLEMFINKN